MSKGSGALGSQLGPWSHSLPVPIPRAGGG